MGNFQAVHFPEAISLEVGFDIVDCDCDYDYDNDSDNRADWGKDSESGQKCRDRRSPDLHTDKRRRQAAINNLWFTIDV